MAMKRSKPTVTRERAEKMLADFKAKYEVVRMAGEQRAGYGSLPPDAPAAKFDSGKLPWDLLPYDAVREVVRVLQFGASKYAARNWEKGLPYSRTFAATMRHLTAHFQDGETHDAETGISHLAHAACEILFALAFEVRGRKELDDRPGAAAVKP